MQRSTKLLAMGSAIALSFSAAGLQAAGGGGGMSGGSPSQSAPRYDAVAEYQAGIAYLKADNFKDAVKSFKRSLSVAPKNANAQYLLGFSYLKMGDHKKAKNPLEKAVKYNADLIDAHRDLAITYHKLGDAEKANAALGTLTEKQTACGDGCAQKDQLSSAVSAVQNAIIGGEQTSFILPHSYGMSDRETSDAVYLSAVSLINERRYEAALSELEQAGKEFGPHPDVLTYVGFANRKLKRFDIAEDYYQRALAVAPDHLGAIEYYGELKVEKGDMVGAEHHLARLEKLCAFGCYEAEELRRWITEAKRS
ncbi:tetratricopeptide repeat protein [Parasphingorhabdus halotolerans]|uniref:Tetratricopeptide repeat protein n=1 Tax=Parasphingorhabdus halotolerans TaxID=2725558 RepID=A0A6H2DN97_9SPHN|nr:tetratricopeptide repeat protein [Parasphingorhabdus halotolerans]QJB69463.1 tetratricopeptide repeat protein [Parasphingorhabdus halotolerans]